MEINNNLKEKIESIPQGIQEIAMQILHEIERGKKSNKQVEEVVNKINKLWYYNLHSSRCILNACRKVTIVVYEDDKVKGEAQFPLVVATVSMLLSKHRPCSSQ